MQESIYRQIEHGEDVRTNLIALRKTIAEENGKRRLAILLGGDFHVLTALLAHQDPKVRKNAALILGEMETEDVLPFLFRAWEEESTMYVRSAYLEAMHALDISPYVSRLKKRRAELESLQVEPENAKHVREELRALQTLLIPYEKAGHIFREETVFANAVLVTGGALAQRAADRLPEQVQPRVKGSTVWMTNAAYTDFASLRIWSELLIPTQEVLSDRPERAGAAAAKLHLADLLNEWHSGSGIWRYRAEIRGALPDQDKGRFLRRFTGELDRLSGGTLANAPSDYEVTFRLLRRKDGKYSLFIKPDRMPDNRFRYRREWIPESISPVTAAGVLELASAYLKPEARVLDPFCGAGTLLTERCYAGSVQSAYGTDIYENAVEMARRNAATAKMPIHFIHRDCRTFTHEYPFDEIITDLPRGAGTEGSAEAGRLLAAMLDKAPEWLGDTGVLILYTLDMDMVYKELTGRVAYVLEQQVQLNAKSGAGIFVLRYNRVL